MQRNHISGQGSGNVRKSWSGFGKYDAIFSSLFRQTFVFLLDLNVINQTQSSLVQKRNAGIVGRKDVALSANIFDEMKIHSVNFDAAS